MQQEIEIGIARVRPLEPKPVAKVVQLAHDGLPRWLRDRIESTTVPADADRDENFRDIVSALADLGWATVRIAAEIAGRPWVPARYAGHNLIDWAIPVALAQAWGQARTREALANQAMTLARNASGSVRTDKIESDDAAPDGLRPPATVTDATAESKDAIATWIGDRCERDASSWELSAALFASWTSWAEGAGG